ncbi:type IV toxin-antitoxin system AbiEi family antitoxin domain-containing protein [Pengzhenrongella sp.]|jgi:very-short-patch-repair endonuclease|uniref:type IV toxin-antitoxin system AbiEi family antitoxin domain-containing protein n=1 Tax=Pengzhenrongella sp. TaxID=2888820 RepID=UPI002F959BCA
MTLRFPADWEPHVAARQAGLFTARQAISAGMTYAQVRRRRESGRWTRVVGDALALATLPLDAWTRAQGAWLTWPDAVVCLASAAAVHGLPVPVDGVLHVSVLDHRPPRHNLVAHQLRVATSEISPVGHALVTDRRRTLFDCLGRLPDRDSEALMIWAITRELITRDELADAIAHRPRAWGNARRRRALDDVRDGAMGAGERRLHDILRGAEITGWCADAKLSDREGVIGRADVLFPAQMLIIEVDGMAYHGAASFQADRTRQNRLVNAGYTVLRFTWADLTTRPDQVLREIRLALVRR